MAADICARVLYAKMSLKEAAESVILERLVAQQGQGGVIAIDRTGAIVTPFNTTGMYRGHRRAGEQPVVRIFKDSTP